MKKRIMSCICLVCIIASMLAVTASASDEASFSFTVTSSNGYTSASAYKNDTTDAEVYPSSGTNYSYGATYSVRNTSGTTVSGSSTRYNLDSFSLSYKSGYATSGTYRCLRAIGVSSKSVSISGVWYP